MGGFERHGFVPDIVTLGRPMGNGYPIGGGVAREAVMRPFGDSCRYSNTFAGNTVAVKTADTVLTILQRDDLQTNALRMGARLKAGLSAIRERTGRIRAVRSVGLFCGIEMGQASDPPDRRRALATAVTNNLRDNRVLISTTGIHEDTLKVRPMLVCNENHVDLFLDKLQSAIERCAQASSEP